MILKDWIYEVLDKTFPEGFDWEYVAEDDFFDDDALDGDAPKGFAFLAAKCQGNEVYLYSMMDIAEAKKFVTEEIEDGDCMANGGRGGPDYGSTWVILDLVGRKIIDIGIRNTIEFSEPR
jgi:hypothetical protein